MNTPLRPSFALRQQRDGLRPQPLRGTRAGAHALRAAEHGCASDSVCKRLPAIGEVPSALVSRIHG